MPPDSHSIFEEGAVFKSFKIVKEGVFQEEGKTEVLQNHKEYLKASFCGINRHFFSFKFKCNFPLAE